MKPSFTHRSGQKELLDRNDIPFGDIKKNMHELNLINQYLGGHKITLKGFKQLVNKDKSLKPLNVAEIGCGGGDNLRVLKNWADVNDINATFTGIDINPGCIDYANSLAENKGITFLHSDYREMHFPNKPDIIFSSLFTHHFTDDELIIQLQWMKDNSQLGFFINDLHRHPLAYYAIKLLTKLFSRSYLVKNDAPLSVMRAFKKSDWKKLMNEASINNFTIQWQWAFRWLIISDNHAIAPGKI